MMLIIVLIQNLHTGVLFALLKHQVNCKSALVIQCTLKGSNCPVVPEVIKTMTCLFKNSEMTDLPHFSFYQFYSLQIVLVRYKLTSLYCGLYPKIWKLKAKSYNCQIYWSTNPLKKTPQNEPPKNHQPPEC